MTNAINNNFIENKPLKVFFLLLFLGLLTYSNAIFHPFVHDDVAFIQHNPQIRDLNLSDIFTRKADFGDGHSIVNSYYRPLLEVFNRIQYAVFGLNASGYHLVNIVLHVINGFLVFSLLNVILNGQRRISLAVAVLFLVHPLQTESVAYISGISDLIFTLFCLLSFLCYLRSKYVLALSVFFVSLFAKEHSAILPFLIVFYESILGRDRKKNLPILGYFAVIGLYFLLRKVLLAQSVGSIFVFDTELTLRLLAIPKILLIYIGLLIWPTDLHFYRNIDILHSSYTAAAVFAVMAISIIFLIRILPAEKHKTLIFSLGWFVVVLLPTINIIPLILEFSHIFVAEHFLYLPSIGFFLFVIMVAQHFLRNVRLGYVGMIFAAVCLCLMTATIRQNTFYRTETSLFEQTIRHEPHFGRGHYLLARAYYFSGQVDKAITHFQKALVINQSYVDQIKNTNIKGFYLNNMKNIYFDLAHCYEYFGDFQSSLKQYTKALAISPRDTILHNNIGVNYMKLKDLSKAIEHFQQAAALDSTNVMAVRNLQNAKMQLNATVIP